jgi:MULE transposase domain
MPEFGNGQAIFMDATFCTNQHKFPLYTGLVVDQNGTGLPIFHVLVHSSSQASLATWMDNFQRHMESKQPGWRPSCFIVDDAQAEINAIR